MKGFKPEELEGFLGAIFALAWADRVIQKEEEKLLREMLSTYDLSSELKALTEKWFSSPISIDDVNFSIFSEEAKAYIYLSAWLVAKADGKLDREESSTLGDLAARLNLADSVIERIRSENKIENEMF